MKANDYLEIIQGIMSDASQSAERKMENILLLFRRDLSALMYFPHWWLEIYPATVQALREDLKKGFYKKMELVCE